MARGTTLGQLVLMLREEIGDATSAALGQNNLSHLKQTLRRTQEFLWNDHSWPHLRVEREEVLQAGERYYTLPADLSFDRVEGVPDCWIKYDETWRPVCYGITPDHYNVSDPEQDECEDPVRCWQVYEDEQYEVWPLPATDGYRLRFTGIRKLRPLLDDADRADLDDNLIVLFAAAEILARRKSADADAKRTIAGRLYQKLKGAQSKKSMFVMGGGRDPLMGPRIERPRPLYGKRV